MRILAAAVLCVVLAGPASAGERDLGGLKIKAGRLPSWNPGIRGGIPEVPVKVNVRKMGAVGDFRTDDAPAIQRAIDRVEAPGAVLVPAGIYLIRKTLELKPGVVLRGEGVGKSRLHFVYNTRHNQSWRYPSVVRIAPPKPKEDPRFIDPYRDIDVHLESGYKAGSRELITFKPCSLRPGQYVVIVCDNDPNVHNGREAWLEKSWYNKINIIGQILRIESVSGRKVEVDRPLYLSFQTKMMPRLRVMEMTERCGVERLHITNQTCGHVIDMQYALECWVADCHLEYSYRTHVSVAACRDVVIRDNYIHHGHDYAGGEGYGVWLGHWTTDCLVENNVFDHLRHSMVTTLGACGNVFGYNCSGRSRHPGGGDDLCQHGFFSYANLFEGNVGTEAVYADYWGPVGPRNTCYRNRLKKGIQVRDRTHDANIVGNTFMGGSVTVEEGCRDAWIEKNLFVFTKSNPTPSGIDGLAGNLEGEVLNISTKPDWAIPASLYLKSKPSFWGNRPWPGIGAEVDLENVRARTPLSPIPAEERYRQLVK